MAIVGTGASSMQIAPTIADKVAKLTIFSAARNGRARFRAITKTVRRGAISAGACAVLCRLVSLHHVLALWRRAAAIFEKDPDWPHPERAMNRINDRHREEMVAHIEAKLEGGLTSLQNPCPTIRPMANAFCWIMAGMTLFARQCYPAR